MKGFDLSQPQRATSPDPKPSCFFLCFFVLAGLGSGEVGPPNLNFADTRVLRHIAVHKPPDVVVSMIFLILVIVVFRQVPIISSVVSSSLWQ